MVVEPGATAVTGTCTAVVPAVNVATEGTVATFVLLEERFTTTPPAGAWAESVSVKFWVPVPVMVKV